MKSLTKHIEERLIINQQFDEKLIINQRFDEKLIINKDYKNITSSLLELAKKIWCDPQHIDKKASKEVLQQNWLWVTGRAGTAAIFQKLLSFADEISNNINEYDHRKSLVYLKHGTDNNDKNKMLKEIITIANEEDLSELLFQSNPRASKYNVQLIRIKDDNVMMYVRGHSIFKKGKFDVDNIGTFKIIILYND